MSHTPGEWNFNAWGDHEIEIFAGDKEICEMSQVYDDNGQGTYENIEDDARLIAAAPDLLGALQSLLHQVYQMRGMFPDEDGTIAAAIQDAEDAINQAKGKT